MFNLSTVKSTLDRRTSPLEDDSVLKERLKEALTKYSKVLAYNTIKIILYRNDTDELAKWTGQIARIFYCADATKINGQKLSQEEYKQTLFKCFTSNKAYEILKSYQESTGDKFKITPELIGFYTDLGNEITHEFSIVISGTNGVWDEENMFYQLNFLLKSEFDIDLIWGDTQSPNFLDDDDEEDVKQIPYEEWLSSANLD